MRAQGTASSAGAALTQLVRNVKAMPPAPWPWPASLWRGALIGLIAAAGAVTDRYQQSLLVALGAFCVILVDPQLSARRWSLSGWSYT